MKASEDDEATGSSLSLAFGSFPSRASGKERNLYFRFWFWFLVGFCLDIIRLCSLILHEVLFTV